MSRSIAAAIPAALLLAACGPTELPVTNAGNVVPNQTQANIAFSNDEPILQDQPVINGSDVPGNETRADRVIANPADVGLTTSRTAREQLNANAAAARGTN